MQASEKHDEDFLKLQHMACENSLQSQLLKRHRKQDKKPYGSR
ncbi:hypothetical protein KP509_19G064100 [Ceratopteris richardii]|uniref:Uncharacterized protein n=1 Tax=Ceratopteris richardii TaxID=49495 RepID=A0A8T2SKT6_CERRI|nr:hypothetical protein KP509_19G064100 [Ceratopteris richardii]